MLQIRANDANREETRKSIILDKSSLEAMAGDILYKVDRDFHLILTIELYEEIQDSTRCNRGQIAKLMAATRNLWIPPSFVLLAWELEHNFSSKFLINRERKVDLYVQTPQLVMDFLRQDVARLAYEKSNPRSARFLECVKGLGSLEELLPVLSFRMQGIDLGLPANDIMQMGTTRGLPIHPSFQLREDMFCSGLAIAHEGSYLLKLWRYGDAPADPKKPDNYGRDVELLAYMNICDGIISNDKWMLAVAWACWPTKRSSILTYDNPSRSLQVYDPFRTKRS